MFERESAVISKVLRRLESAEKISQIVYIELTASNSLCEDYETHTITTSSDVVSSRDFYFT